MIRSIRNEKQERKADFAERAAGYSGGRSRQEGQALIYKGRSTYNIGFDEGFEVEEKKERDG